MKKLKITKQVTNCESESLEKYLYEIGKIPLLNNEEEIKFAQFARKTYKIKAINFLIKANLRFVVSVAKQYQNQGLNLSDLINEGNLGLIKGIFRFDERKGFKCISYSVWWIRQSILQAIADKSRCVRCPTNKLAFYNKVNKKYSELEQIYQIPPSIKHIGEYLNSNEKEIEEALKNSVKHTSLDAPIIEGENSNLYDIIKYDEYTHTDLDLEKESLKKDIKRLLDTLSEKEAQIITLHYGLESSTINLEEISFLLNLTRERCRQIEIYGLRRLKKSSRKNILRFYLCT
ncbi:sigma-70 family RNA polymerase sigma factor [Candidatus Karelsulcia muelleri]|uniref:RNA polymerase sigma factor rpoD n=1 Tax=Candidatus Karelsulcia muelleri PSPU TaxID=1189303 RepID=A0AAD1AY60_9FLAO|nr:RNA polymerase sigma factor RpoD/SigA [Candidatus Karelsulcia muelleri]NJJ98726.1 sigma-70 family RNA polymerase sigma factor [Candidatus Karelsulcia muelleri]BAO66378.1 RNA polymerase sigma factor rpoD [Candidatus Karelsulcia muelleri PSPU]